MVAIAKSWHQIAPLLGKIIGPVFLLDKAGFTPGCETMRIQFASKDKSPFELEWWSIIHLLSQV